MISRIRMRLNSCEWWQRAQTALTVFVRCVCHSTPACTNGIIADFFFFINYFWFKKKFRAQRKKGTHTRKWIHSQLHGEEKLNAQAHNIHRSWHPFDISTLCTLNISEPSNKSTQCIFTARANVNRERGKYGIYFFFLQPKMLFAQWRYLHIIK